MKRGKKIKKRCLSYEMKFRKYIYSFDLDTHKKICENINLSRKKTNEEE